MEDCLCWSDVLFEGTVIRGFVKLCGWSWCVRFNKLLLMLVFSKIKMSNSNKQLIPLYSTFHSHSSHPTHSTFHRHFQKSTITIPLLIQTTFSPLFLHIHHFTTITQWRFRSLFQLLLSTRKASPLLLYTYCVTASRWLI